MAQRKPGELVHMAKTTPSRLVDVTSAAAGFPPVGRTQQRRCWLHTSCMQYGSLQVGYAVWGKTVHIANDPRHAWGVGSSCRHGHRHMASWLAPSEGIAVRCGDTMRTVARGCSCLLYCGVCMGVCLGDMHMLYTTHITKKVSPVTQLAARRLTGCGVLAWWCAWCTCCSSGHMLHPPQTHTPAGGAVSWVGTGGEEAGVCVCACVCVCSQGMAHASHTLSGRRSMQCMGGITQYQHPGRAHQCQHTSSSAPGHPLPKVAEPQMGQ